MSFTLEYSTDAQMAVTGVSIDILIPLFTDKPSRFPWLRDVSEETISQLLVLAKLAFDGTKEDQLIFHGRDGALETLGRVQRVYGLFSLQYYIGLYMSAYEFAVLSNTIVIICHASMMQLINPLYQVPLFC